MIVIQRCHVQGLEPSALQGVREGNPVELPEQAGKPWSGMVGLQGVTLSRDPIEWVISREGVRSLSFPHQVVMVPHEEIERFVVTFAATDVFSLWTQGCFRFPTRISLARRPPWWSRRGTGAALPERERLPLQNMEMGSSFGTVSQQRLVATMHQLGYVVVEIPWSRWLG